MTKRKLELLSAAASNLVKIPPPQRRLQDEETWDWFSKHGMVYGQVDLASGAAAGFNLQGARAINDLTAVLRNDHAKYLRGTDFAAFATALAKIVISIFIDRSPANVVAEDITSIETSLAHWFAEQAIFRKHLIPCAIIPERASPFPFGQISGATLGQKQTTQRRA